ncbi:uncharacterized protein HKW66_Vig0230200 [Vigna angularis]|uniref:Uncharacterized protein n=1 Tax=Phaseolus angularis TaxID=3914 RepID=A0A8T0KF41_PHAAN|nr:uncharacterized protein HKW66_Vig0230200 [Vigna angularis]
MEGKQRERRVIVGSEACRPLSRIRAPRFATRKRRNSLKQGGTSDVANDALGRPNGGMAAPITQRAEVVVRRKDKVGEIGAMANGECDDNQ